MRVVTGVLPLEQTRELFSLGSQALCVPQLISPALQRTWAVDGQDSLSLQ